MSAFRVSIVLFAVTIVLVIEFSCAEQDEAVQEPVEVETTETPEAVDIGEITRDELYGTIPEIEELHSAVYPLWHTAYPQKDYDLIKELLPQLDSLTAKLDEAPLPRILHMKSEAWDKGKEELKAVLGRLHEAVDSDDKTEILNQTEAFHSFFEQLPQIISPAVPELETFHRELYKIVHYYMPNSEIDKIRETITAMQEKIQPLAQAELPENLAARSEDFSRAVKELESTLTSLVAISGQDDMTAIEGAIKELHTAYVAANELLY